MKAPLLIFLPARERGGCEEYALVVSREADRRGYVTHVCFPQIELTTTLREDFERVGAVMHDWPPAGGDARQPWGTFAEQKRHAAELFAKIQPHRIWMALPWVDAGVGFLAACGEVGMSGLCVWQLATEIVSIPAAESLRARRSLSCGLKWITVSEESRAFISESFQVSKARIRVVYNGLLSNEKFPLAPLELREKQRLDVRRELGLPQDAQLVTTVARLCREQKGHEYLLEAIARLGSLKKTYFLWVGDGQDASWLKGLVAQAGLTDSIRMLGFRSDIARLLTASDLFVLPSNLEGMPFTIFEAMACGCPVVATATGGTSEVLMNNKDALVVPVRNPEAMARSIAETLRDPVLRQRLSQNAFRTVARHTSERMLSQSFSLLENAPNKRINNKVNLAGTLPERGTERRIEGNAGMAELASGPIHLNDDPFSRQDQPKV